MDVKLSYRIDIDFCLYPRQGATNSSTTSFENAFSFSVPIEVIVKRQLLLHPSTIMGDELLSADFMTQTTDHSQKTDLSSAEYIQHRAIECLESDIICYPLHFKRLSFE